jgi:CoA:oxalate CoA-transferase
MQHWIDRLNIAGVPCSPINTIDKVLDHPQLEARNMIIKVQGESGRAFRTAGSPIRISGYAENDVVNPIAAPGLNQHREAILSEVMARSGAYSPATRDTQLAPTDPEINEAESWGLATARA